MSDIKKRTFSFDEQESYTKLELQGILTQHDKFHTEGHNKVTEKMKTRLSELEAQNTEFSTKERTRTINKVAKSISADNFEKLVKYSNIPSDADENAIKTILAETSKDILQTPVDTKTPEVKVVGEVKPPTKSDTKLDKFKDL